MKTIKKPFYCFVFATAVLACQFLLYILHSQILGVMDAGGWFFYITSCISHAACIAMLPFIIHSLFSVIGLRRTGNILSCAIAVIASCLVLVNEQVYQLYRFHINGFIINMVTGPAAGEIFTFDAMLYVKYVLTFIFIATIYAAGWWFCNTRVPGICRRKTKRSVIIPLSVIIFSTLSAHIYHVFASFYEKQSVITSERLLPYYFPTTSYGLLTETFHLDAPKHTDINIGKAEGDMQYPLSEINIEECDSVRPNILLILIDSWNRRSLTEECMPNVFRYAKQNSWYRNHVSCSNGTRSSVFGIWFGIPSYYWNIAESNHVTPVILDVARDEGYRFHNYPAASQLDPPFGRVLFAKEKDVRISTPGANAYDRDKQITDDFIADINSQEYLDQPFISFLFYDLPHSFELSEEQTKTFQPSWLYADYSKLNNDMDPTPFWNLYRNTCYEADKQIARVFEALEQKGLDKNTIVIVTGDHSQEFNENRKNYWGHNSNFSVHQIGVPLIMHVPGESPRQYTHRTTHYDIVPTLMSLGMGVTNPTEEYSMGHLLSDPQDRNWHAVGSELNYAFIIQGDTILEKTAEGSLNVFDSKMNIVTDYHLNPTEFKKAVDRLNRFIR